MKKLFKVISRMPKWLWIKAIAWVHKLHISPITQWWCDKKLLEAANKTALYSLARKEDFPYENEIIPPNISDSGKITPEHIESANKTVTIGGDLSYIMSAPGFGFTFPWPDSLVRYLTETRADALYTVSKDGMVISGLDGLIVEQIADHTLAADRVFYKRTLTRKTIEAAVQALGEPINCFYDGDSWNLLLATSRKRIERGNLGDDPGWEDEMCYRDYISRDLYPGEYGRLKLSDGLYVVVLCTLDERMQRSLLFGPGAFIVTPLKKNLHAIFRQREVAERRVIDVGYQMQFGAVGDKTRCVVLEAERSVEKV